MSVPASVPELGLLFIASVTLAVEVRTFSPASLISTLMAGELEAVETALVGSTVKVRWSAAPAVILKVLLVSPVTAVAAAVSV